MTHYETIKCPNCNCENIRKNGKSENGTQRWCCMNSDCPKASFQLSYTYTVHIPIALVLPHFWWKVSTRIH